MGKLRCFCTQRVTMLWNSLPVEAVMAKRTDGFKIRSGRLMEERSIRRISTCKVSKPQNTSARKQQRRRLRPLFPVYGTLKATDFPWGETGYWIRWTTGLIQQGSSYIWGYLPQQHLYLSLITVKILVIISFLLFKVWFIYFLPLGSCSFL